MAEIKKGRTLSDPAPTKPVTTTANHHEDGFSDCSRHRPVWRRRLLLDCGCWDHCRCQWRNNPSDRRIDGYRDALEHLAEHGLCGAALTPELRGLWRRGGADRRIAEDTVRRWTA